MNFSKAGNVREAVDSMRTNEEQLRSENRARINDVFNGVQPWTETEAQEDNADSNVNFLEAATIAHRARSTWNNAFLKPGKFFSVTLNSGPAHKRAEWSTVISTRLSRIMKRSRRYVEVIRATGAQVVLHGPGPVWWDKQGYWLPKEVGIEDLLLPSATKVNLENLPHFAIFQQFTAGELYRMTNKKHRDSAWNMKAVNAELKRIAGEFAKSYASEVELSNPEKLSEFYRSNGGVFDSDRVPTIDVWTFFHQNDDEKDERWYKKMILASPAHGDTDFLYNSSMPYGDELSQILHIQFGDGANVAPFLYHSVRSLGQLLYATCHIQNRLRNRFMDAIFEAMLMYFRNVGEGDRAKIEKVDLHHLGLIPEGLSLVPQSERWQVNENLVVAGLSQNRQLMAENASAFVQDVDSGTEKELTATEVMARLNSANALVASLLSQAYTYQHFQYEEICRRFCDPKSTDPDVKEFREECVRARVPEKYLNVKCWDIQVERVMGGGNKTLEIAQAKSLMEVRSILDPPSQRIVLRNYVLAITDDSGLAMTLVPEEPERDNPATAKAQWNIGAIMHGVSAELPQHVERISYTETLIKGLQELIQQSGAIQQQGGELPDGKTIVGMVKLYAHIVENMQILAQNEAEQQRVRQYGDLLKDAMNQVKQFANQLAEKQQQQSEAQSEMVKMQVLMAQAKVKSMIAVNEAKLKAMLQTAEFKSDERRKNMEVQADMQRKGMETMSDVQALMASTTAEIEALDAKTAAEITSLDRKTTAVIDAKEKATDAQIAASRKAAAAKPDSTEQ